MKKDVVFFVERLSTGGAERVVAALANSLSENEDYEIYIITYHSQELNEYAIAPNVRRIALKSPHKKRLGTIYHRYSELKMLLKKIEPYCVFSLAIPKTDAILLLAARKRSYPLVISERNDPERFPTEKPMRWLRNFVYKRCEGLVFQTPGAKAYFDDMIKCKSTVICNPITATLPKRYEGVREHRIVNFCRIEPQKNLKMAIDAFAMLHEEFPDYTLEFYGEGSQKQALMEYAERIHIGNKVIFHGYAPNIHAKIIKAALFVSTSDYEGISNSMLEAMAIGIPSICTDCPPGGARSVITDNVNGMLVPVGDTEKMAEAMKTVLQDQSLQERLSLNASKLADSLQPNMIAKQWIDFLEEIRK